MEPHRCHLQTCCWTDQRGFNDFQVVGENELYQYPRMFDICYLLGITGRYEVVLHSFVCVAVGGGRFSKAIHTGAKAPTALVATA